MDRLFLEVQLKRLPEWLANLLTLVIVIVGWTIFRAASLTQAGALLSLMAQPFASASAPVAIPPEYVLIGLIAAAICVAQRIGASMGDVNWGGLAQRFSLVSNSLLALLFVAALAKGLADPFKPFIYFRF